MLRTKTALFGFCFLIVIGLITSVFAEPPQRGGPGRSPLFFDEEWQQTPEGGEHPVTPQSVSNPNLELKLYGAKAEELQINGTENSGAKPAHIWSALCNAGCALAFRHRASNVDLAGLARIRWNTKMPGLH